MATLRKEVLRPRKSLSCFKGKKRSVSGTKKKKRQTKALVSQFRIRPLLTFTGKEPTIKKMNPNLSYCVRVDDFTDISALQGFTLESYVATKEKICIAEHTQPCKLCTGLLTVAKRIADDGYIRLNEAFSISSPGVKYKSTHAKRKLLQMPLAAIRIKREK
ncbi:unnamed protein product [Porites lobata]|uniref:Uncharacterized protein n=1 Tax=Porites lobata TaxID=104759 RepID=A0ABN8QJ25_9CNID|nr:unnamed protein product [Porites lobata]